MSTRDKVNRMPRLELLARLTWYLLGLYLVAAYVRGPVVSAYPDVLPMLQAGIGLLLLIALFLVVPAAVTAVGSTPVSYAHPFPSPVTLIVGVWLVIFSVAAAFALVISLFPPSWLTAQLSGWQVSTDPALGSGLNDALVTVFAAAVGSSITTIQGYLRHASTQGDFKTSFAPWYVARPLMGTLLGLLFYLVLKAGLLLLGTGDDGTTIDRWALAAVGGLVGLSSKPAIEKLREVFQMLFRAERPQNIADDAAGAWTVSQLDALISDPQK